MERREFLAALGTAATVAPPLRFLLRLAAEALRRSMLRCMSCLKQSRKEAEVAEFLKGGLPVVEAEPATIAWFGIRLGPSTFAIFDAFPDDAGRQAHLAGKVAAALMAKAGDLLTEPPSIQKADVLGASKLPG